jgi:hypothetical protein
MPYDELKMGFLLNRAISGTHNNLHTTSEADSNSLLKKEDHILFKHSKPAITVLLLMSAA